MASEMSQPGLLTEIKTLLEEQLKPVTDRLDSIEEALTHISTQDEQIQALENRCKNLEDKCDVLQRNLDESQTQKKKLQEELLSQETYSRRNNIRMYGIVAHTQENLEKVVIQTLEKAGITITPNDIDRIHYIGQPRTGNRRPVLLRLLRWKDKDAIMKAKERLRQSNIAILEDYPKEVVNRRKMLLPVFFKALELYPALNPKFHMDRLVLGGKTFTVDNIKRIQYPELMPERVFTPVEGGVQAYFTKFSPLSNFFPSTIQEGGKIFPTSEHYFTYKKALHFEDKDTAQAILETKEPETVKMLGKKIQGYNKSEWYKVSTEYLFSAMMLKFTQNEDLKGFLLSTTGNKLIEASGTDKFWGIGQSLRSSDLFNQAKWTGKNIAGKTLERVRQTLM